MSNFAENLKILRQTAGLSQGALAKRLGLSQSTIGMYEAGHREPSIDHLRKLARLLDTDVNTLVGPPQREDACPPEAPLADLIDRPLARLAYQHLKKLPPKALEERKTLYRKILAVLIEQE